MDNCFKSNSFFHSLHGGLIQLHILSLNVQLRSFKVKSTLFFVLMTIVKIDTTATYDLQHVLEFTEMEFKCFFVPKICFRNFHFEDRNRLCSHQLVLVYGMEISLQKVGQLSPLDLTSLSLFNLSKACKRFSKL